MKSTDAPVWPNLVRGAAFIALLLSCGVVGSESPTETEDLSRATGRLGPECAAPANAIVAENCREDGIADRTDWDLPDWNLLDPNGCGPSIRQMPNSPGLPSGTVCQSVHGPFFEHDYPYFEGFSTKFSVFPGETIQFKVQSNAQPFEIRIYRLGWYQGKGARLVTSFAGIPQAQPSCLAITSEGESIPSCANWVPSGQWVLPIDAVSGLYLAKLVRAGGAEQAHVPFVVREPSTGVAADVVYQFADSTWQAYNTWENRLRYMDATTRTCLDGAASTGNPRCTGSIYDNYNSVSYDRPWWNRFMSHFGGPIQGPYHWLFDVELPMIRFLERNGYSVGYMASADTDSTPNPLLGRKAYLATGHEEYWSGSRLSAVEQAAQNGTNMLFLAGNLAYYKTRWKPGPDGTPNRILVVYKHEREVLDPLRNTVDWTGVWRNVLPNAAYSRPSAQPARSGNALTGVSPAAAFIFPAPLSPHPGFAGANLTVPASMGGLRFWRNTTCASGGCILGRGGNVAFEMDARADRYYEPFVGVQPAGLISTSATVANNGWVQGTTPSTTGLSYGLATYTDDALPTCSQCTEAFLTSVTVETTLHRKSSGALVFAGSSFRWAQALDDARSWGFDTNNTGVMDAGVFPGTGVSRDMQQATVNVLTDMGVQPGSLMSGIVAATKSTDVTAPTSHITEINRSTGVITGTASDVGGVVAGVEVSFDNGTNWHGAVLTNAATPTTWAYAAVEPANITPRVRAVDDSGNVETSHGPDSPLAASDGFTVLTTAPTAPGNQNLSNSYTASPGWTLVVPLNLNNDGRTDLLSYNAQTGAAVYSIATTGPSCAAGVYCTQQVVASITAARGWTSIVPLNINNDFASDLLSYNAKTGEAVYSVAVQTGCPSGVYCGQQVVRSTTAATGWTSIVPMTLNSDSLTDLLSYNSATGFAMYSVADSINPQQQNVVSSVSATPGWTSIVPIVLNADGRTDLLSYNAATGSSVYSVAATAPYPCPSGVSCVQQVVATRTAATGWTSIVPLDMNTDGFTDLYSYNAATGAFVFSVAASGAPCPTGVFCNQQVVYASTGGSQWPVIVPVKLNSDALTDMLFYR